jgi:hypothetical protein
MSKLGKVFLTFGVLLVVLAAAFGVFVYATAGNASDTNPVSVDGPWSAQQGSVTFMAIIAGDGIEVQWVDGDDTSALYWKGTFPMPPNAHKGDEFQVTSVGDTEAMGNSLLGSQDSTKVFTYKKGELSFTLRVAGVKQTVHLEMQELGV